MNVRDVREALGAALAAQSYRVYDVLPENAQLPCAAVLWPEEILYHRTGSDASDVEIVVTVAVSVADFAKAQKAIDAAISTGPGSFMDAVESHATTAWDAVQVVSSSNIRQLTEPSALAVDFTIQLYAP